MNTFNFKLLTSYILTNKIREFIIYSLSILFGIYTTYLIFKNFGVPTATITTRILIENLIPQVTVPTYLNF